MEPNDNPPSEREWTIAEREEFFTSQDARTGSYPGLSGNPISMTPFRPTPSTHNCADNLAKGWSAGIHITSIVPPEYGWPIAMHCPICKETTFLLSPWAVKPTMGDYFKIEGVCAADRLSAKHNRQMATETHPLEVGFSE